MQPIKDNAPTLLMFFLQGLIFAAVNRGFLTAEQAVAMAGLLATLGSGVTQRMAPPKKGPPKSVTMSTCAFIAIVMLLTGCSATLNGQRMVNGKLGAAPPPSEYCRSLDNSHRTWGAFAKGSALLAGASGFATMPVDGATEEKALAYASLGAAAVTAVAVFVSEGAAASHARDCR